LTATITTTVPTTTTVTTTYSYDGDGERLTKKVGTNPTISYVYDVNGSLPVVLSDGTLKYVYGLGLAYTVDVSDTVQTLQTDGLGSVRAITDSTGKVIQTFQADFGAPREDEVWMNTDFFR